MLPSGEKKNRRNAVTAPNFTLTQPSNDGELPLNDHIHPPPFPRRGAACPLISGFVIYRCSSRPTDEFGESQPWRDDTLHAIMELTKLIRMEYDKRSNVQTLSGGRHTALPGERRLVTGIFS